MLKKLSPLNLIGEKQYNRCFAVFCFLLFFLMFSAGLSAQQNIRVDASASSVAPFEGHIKLGTNRSSSGHSLDANSLYFLKDGKPWYPVMGEFHFSRYPASRWNEAIGRMKAAGIDVVATYIFWNHHQEADENFNWSGNRNLRHFVELCAKQGMYVWVRIGPWCHGEVRNGGLPDRIIKRGNIRRNDPQYLADVSTLYSAIAAQLNGLYFKDNGPVIGAQIENEYRFNNPAGLAHILALKTIAVEKGIDVPFYSATGWPGSDQKQRELLLVWGAYPEAPWDKKTDKLKLSQNYLFGPLRNDPAIGADLLGRQDSLHISKTYPFPYATAEMGAGNQITYHRRPLISSADVTALAYVKAGSGANLMGYYMFHGGSNPIGRLSTLQESRATRYPNDYPIISYDFQSPIGEWGQLRESYSDFKLLHYFFNDFGDRLAPMRAYFPDKAPSEAADLSQPRLAVRSQDSSGFIFVSNYQRQAAFPSFKQTGLSISLPAKKILHFAENEINFCPGLQAVFPFNMKLGPVNLYKATVQPFCVLKADVPVYVFFVPDGQQGSYVFDTRGISEIKVNGRTISSRNKRYYVNQLANASEMIIRTSGNTEIRILTLNAATARKSWKFSEGDKDYLVYSDAPFLSGNAGFTLNARSSGPLRFSVFPRTLKIGKTEGISRIAPILPGFASYALPVSVPVPELRVEELTDLNRLKPGVSRLPADDRLPAVDPFQPGPLYQTALRIDSGARYFNIQVKNYNRAPERHLLQIDYLGDTGALYRNGELVADDFFSGQPMLYDPARHGAEQTKLVLEIIPWQSGRKVFFEDPVRNSLLIDSAAVLKSLSWKSSKEIKVPVYR